VSVAARVPPENPFAADQHHLLGCARIMGPSEMTVVIRRLHSLTSKKNQFGPRDSSFGRVLELREKGGAGKWFSTSSVCKSDI
jgi:hypothetical protein